ncbi:hypothetical protein SK141_1449 [Streptococcus oralis]|nr:hypothetical protein SK141_1449 [Streptococcus oralis]
MISFKIAPTSSSRYWYRALEQPSHPEAESHSKNLLAA